MQSGDQLVMVWSPDLFKKIITQACVLDPVYMHVTVIN